MKKSATQREPGARDEAVPLAPVSLFKSFVGALSQSRLDAAKVMLSSGITESMLKNAAGSLPMSRWLELLETASVVTGIDDLAIRLSSLFHPKQLDAWGYVVLNSPTVGEGLRNMARYSRVFGDSMYAGVRTTSKGLVIEYLMEGLPEVPKRQDAEISAVMALNSVRIMTGARINPLEVHFEHAPPKKLTAYRAFFGAPILFGQSLNRMFFSHEVASRRVQGSDPALLEILKQHLDQSLSAKPQVDELEAAIEVIVRGSGSAQDTSLPSVASKLNINSRTLQRRLRDRGTSFGEIVNKIRNERAKQLLKETDMQVKEIAYSAGFANPAAFAKAFRSWNKMSPNEFRTRGG